MTLEELKLKENITTLSTWPDDAVCGWMDVLNDGRMLADIVLGRGGYWYVLDDDTVIPESEIGIWMFL
jgi:hypothetical protein